MQLPLDCIIQHVADVCGLTPALVDINLDVKRSQHGMLMEAQSVAEDEWMKVADIASDLAQAENQVIRLGMGSMTGLEKRQKVLGAVGM